jgi:protein tyrosine phosphatase
MISDVVKIASDSQAAPAAISEAQAHPEVGTLEWMRGQAKTIAALIEELSDVRRVQELGSAIDTLSDSNIDKPHSVADWYWEHQEGSFLVEEIPHSPLKQRWTYPFDDARTCRDVAGFFYNASDLTLVGQKYVAAQSPLATTFADFWKMMIHTNSTTIVALNMAEEDKDEPLPRPVEYWKRDCVEKPLEFDDWKTFASSDPRRGEVVIAFDDWTIRYQGHSVVSEVKGDCAIVRREFTARNSKTNEERQIAQFHYQNWPDFKEAPSTDLFLKLLQLVEAQHKDPNVPLTVHCAAGMGRAGAFIAAHSLRRTLSQKGPDALINLPETIYSMRLARKDMVSEKSFASIADVASRGY